MILRFLGGAREVGRSAILFEESKRILLDYGIKLNRHTEYPIEMPRVDALFLSHAHLDHSGSAPALYNAAPIPTFGTLPTLKLSELLLKDTMKIAKREHSKINFSKKQLREFMSRYINLEYHKSIEFGDLNIELFDAGHISGSAITLLERKGAGENKRIVYTGDFKLGSQLLHKGAEVAKSDVLITEATYALKEHPDRDELIRRFIEHVKSVLDDGGTALVPAFAVGRSQEILAMLYKNGLVDDVYVDGMAREATRIVMGFPDFINMPEVLSKAVQKANFITSAAERADALGAPAIILTPAGMLNGGPVLDYILKLNSASCIFLTGYQVEGTNGRMLLDTGKIRDNHKTLTIKTKAIQYDFSAHAGMSDLHEYARRSSPNRVICVHASEENAEYLAESLRGEGFEAYAPRVGEAIKLS